MSDSNSTSKETSPMPLGEKGLRECWERLRLTIADLRAFIETDDYEFVRRAGERVRELENNEYLSELSGLTDLISNVKAMNQKITQSNGKLDDVDHGLLVQQAVYSISRANILSVGIEFRLKRAKGG
ncbi:MAG: hypothetical protein NZ957_02960 [Thaumarchaeota archaeon]|nr:hypothetical protein [Candidatus Calditenuaceae archaeon]MDW8042217.1 hypothetical protein [Nitrososphaerota archaeon]